MSTPGHPPRRRGPAAAAGRVHLRAHWLDEREREADQRQALADDREALANERESQANLRDKRLDKRERSLNDLLRRLAGTIERTRALLAADVEHRDLPLAVMGDRTGLTRAGQAETGADHADSDELAAALTRLHHQIEQSQKVRSQTAALFETLAATEEKIAPQHDQMADVSTLNADKYRQFAAAAQRVRANLRNQR